MRDGGAAGAEAWSHPEGEEWSVFYAHPNPTPTPTPTPNPYPYPYP